MDNKNNLRKKIKNHRNYNSSCSNEIKLPLDSTFDFPQLGEASSSPWSVKKAETCAMSKDTQRGDEAEAPSISVQTEPKVNEPNVKKSKRPILLDFSAVVKQKEKCNIRKTVLKSRLMKQNNQLAGNSLDSSNPVRSKGKYREQTKHKLSVLKTNIIKERILKSMASTNPTLDMDDIDFKKEICIYMSNLQNHQRIQDIQPKVCNNNVAKQQFNSKFRWYCENILSNTLNEAVTEFIKRLVNLQDRAFDRDRVRARAHKRFVTGLREAKKYLKLQKVKSLIIAPDLETADRNGPLSLYLTELIEEARNKNVTYAFALDRRKLGYCSLRKAPVSVFTVMNYEGAEAEHTNFFTALEEARISFQSAANERSGLVENDVTVPFKFMTMNETPCNF